MSLSVSTLSAAEVEPQGVAATNAPVAVAETNAPAAVTTTNAVSEAGTHAAPAAAAAATAAAETKAPAAAEEAKAPPMTPQEMFEGGTTTFNNWIELSAGGFVTSGNQSQFRQSRQSTAGPFGGLSDFHYQQNLDKTTVLTADGHALFDENDYKLDVSLTREKLGYVRFGYNEFRTWYNGDGGFYPPSSAWYPAPGDGLALDRGQISFEAGLRMGKVPNITFKYTHDFREGDKSSTIWGYTHPDGTTLVRGLSPSLYHIDEKVDTFQLDVDHRIKSTAFGGGLRYETGELDDTLKITQFPGEAIQQRVTDRQGTTFDMFNAHAFTESWLSKNVMFSTGYSYSDLDNDFTGSRIYGANFGDPYAPDPQSGFGYYGLNGSSHLQEYVLNLNLLAKLTKHLSIVPSLRAGGRNVDAEFTGTQTLSTNAPTPFNGDSSRDDVEVRERLDVSYTGVTNWVFSVRGEWLEAQGDTSENGGLGPVAGFGVPAVQRQTDDTRFAQKYSANARWYPVRLLTANVGGYYRRSDYDYEHGLDSTPNNSPNRYPAYLVGQSLETYDGNCGLTLRPLRNLTVLGRYEYQSTVIHTRPDGISGLGDAESATTTSHIIGANVSWSPWSRLTLQPGLNYVLSETKSPVIDDTPAILKAQNDYWIANLFAGLVVDDKTDLSVNFFYYRADDYVDNSLDGVPYGAGAEEYGITAAIVRRLSKSLRLNLRYGYYHYTDEPSGGNSDYQAHLVSTSLQYRF